MNKSTARRFQKTSFNKMERELNKIEKLETLVYRRRKKMRLSTKMKIFEEIVERTQNVHTWWMLLNVGESYLPVKERTKK